MTIDLFYITPQEKAVRKQFKNDYFLPEIVGGETSLLSGGSELLRKIFETSRSDYILIQTGKTKAELFPYASERFKSLASATGSAFIYSDFIEENETGKNYRATNIYQYGSVRDDFDFGAFVLISRKLLGNYIETTTDNWQFSAFYDFRLFLSRKNEIVRIPEALYSIRKNDNKNKTEKIFEYVQKEFRAIQKEREAVFNKHLKEIKAFLPRREKTPEFELSKFPVLASVIIPVKNREATIAEAINSALSQKTDFDFNIIVVDNHSTDNTGNIVRAIAKKNKEVIHLIPENKNLEIGGCWNLAINEKRCGAFSVQLDSDDIYLQNGSTLQKIINKFAETQAAAVIGSYKTTDFELNEIPPGTVSHDEWTNENGHNNALRINGLGAPRAFYTPIVRKIGFPNVSYGEDYSVMLAITREYKIERIFEPIYFARRWRGNSDANLDWSKKNRYDYYKDFLRTTEIKARINLANKTATE